MSSLHTMRTVKRFVKRAGRITKRKHNAIKNHLSTYQIPYQAAEINFELYFKQPLPIIVEIGFGMGDSLITMSQNQPDRNFIGIEVYDPGVGNIVDHIHNLQLDNLKVMQHDAVQIFKHCIINNSLAGVQIFFPDPWPKKRHHKRRLVNPDFVALVTEKLQDKGFIHFATDVEEYAEVAGEIFNSIPALEYSFESGVLQENRRPQTKFEARGKKLDYAIWDIICYKRHDLIGLTS